MQAGFFSSHFTCRILATKSENIVNKGWHPFHLLAYSTSGTYFRLTCPWFIRYLSFHLVCRLMRFHYEWLISNLTVQGECCTHRPWWRPFSVVLGQDSVATADSPWVRQIRRSSLVCLLQKRRLRDRLSDLEEESMFLADILCMRHSRVPSTCAPLLPQVCKGAVS